MDARVRRAGRVETQAVRAGVVVRITKARKFPQDSPVASNSQGVSGTAGA